MKKGTYKSDGFAAFAFNNKVTIVGAVKKDVEYYSAENVEPLFAETLDELKSIIESKNYTT